MKERPILFSGEMVRAISDDRKTQTRRVIKNIDQKCDGLKLIRKNDYAMIWNKNPEVEKKYVPKGGLLEIALIHCPFGQPGDRLWVKETFHQHYYAGVLGGRPCYKADNDCLNPFNIIPWKPSIFMPRWASRITLEIVKVRVERVQDISLEDINAEGTPYTLDASKRPYGTRREQFQRLFDSINLKKHPWESNPWVWVIEFKKVEA